MPLKLVCTRKPLPLILLPSPSCSISFDAMRRRGASRAAMARRVIERALKLYALGAFLNDGADFSNWRLLGVLRECLPLHCSPPRRCSCC